MECRASRHPQADVSFENNTVTGIRNICAAQHAACGSAFFVTFVGKPDVADALSHRSISKDARPPCSKSRA